MNTSRRQQVISNPSPIQRTPPTRVRNNILHGSPSPSNWVSCGSVHTKGSISTNTKLVKIARSTTTRPQLANSSRSSTSTVPTLITVKSGIGNLKERIKLAASSNNRRRPPMYKQWKRVAEFHDSTEAEQNQANYEGCLWGRRQTRDTKFGLNRYFQCKGVIGSPKCEVYLYLRYIKNGTEVHLYRTENDHSHNSPVVLKRQSSSSLPQRPHKHYKKVQENGKPLEYFDEIEIVEQGTGTSASMQDIERACYTNWKRRSSEIEQELKESYGCTSVDKEMLNEVLQRIRHEFGDDVYNSDNNNDDDDDVVEIKPETTEEEVFTQKIQQQERTVVQENSQDFVSPIVDFDYPMTDEEDIINLPTNPNPSQDPLNQPKGHENDSSILNRKGMIVTEIKVPCNNNKPNYQQHVNSSTKINNNDFKISLDKTKTPTITSVTSLSVTSSKSSTSQLMYQCQDNPSTSTATSSKSKPKFSCRDESKDQGEICLPDEENIKASVLKYIAENYSNRDILHIREELRLIRSERKYPAMYRLASFTTGFLQDAFLGDHLEDKKKNN